MKITWLKFFYTSCWWKYVESTYWNRHFKLRIKRFSVCERKYCFMNNSKIRTLRDIFTYFFCLFLSQWKNSLNFMHYIFLVFELLLLIWNYVTFWCDFHSKIRNYSNNSSLQIDTLFQVFRISNFWIYKKMINHFGELVTWTIQLSLINWDVIILDHLSQIAQHSLQYHQRNC